VRFRIALTSAILCLLAQSAAANPIQIIAGIYSVSLQRTVYTDGPTTETHTAISDDPVHEILTGPEEVGTHNFLAEGAADPFGVFSQARAIFDLTVADALTILFFRPLDDGISNIDLAWFGDGEYGYSSASACATSTARSR